MREKSIATVRVVGKGFSKARAIASALNNVKSSVIKTNSHILLRIEPQNVQVVHAYLKVRKESFLFFFLQREKKIFIVELDVTVQCLFIDPDKIDFIIQ